MFVDRLVRLLAFYRVVSSRIVVRVLFGVGSIIDSIGVGYYRASISGNNI